MRVFLINNDGGGYCQHVDVESGTTVDQLFARYIPGGKPADYLIRVNRLPVASDQVLQDDDRVSITPVKIHGAAAELRGRNANARREDFLERSRSW